jgi:hypothetical protein
MILKRIQESLELNKNVEMYLTFYLKKLFDLF